MQELVTVILAAGAGTRMKSARAKVTHKICGQPMLMYVMDAAKQAGSAEIAVVLGYQADQVREYALGATCVIQEKQLGTGHAVMQARDFLSGRTGTALVLYGDTPVITSGTLISAYKAHQDGGNDVTIITASLDDPTGYGRIVRDSEGRIVAIIEHKDADEKQKAIREINSGMYFFCHTLSSQGTGRAYQCKCAGRVLPDRHGCPYNIRGREGRNIHGFGQFGDNGRK